MKMTKANETAFPYIHKWIHKTLDGDVELASRSNGLTKREYFAAMAMQGIMSSYTIGRLEYSRVAAETAVVCADALILELEKTNND